MTTNPYWIKDGKGKNLTLLTSTEHYEMLETLSLTEAKEWIKRYRKKRLELGKQEAQAWWESVKVDLKKKRGQDGLDTLITNMRQQNETSRSG
jgi:galactose-1-phosphate uridylyltransferase